MAYRNLDLDFSQIVVAAKNFLAIWSVADLPSELLAECASEEGAPNAVGRLLAQRNAARRGELLRLASWSGADLFTPLFEQAPDLQRDRIRGFEQTIRAGKRVRQRVTLRNFPVVLKQLADYFDQQHPIKAVRAFYSMIYAWTETSTVQISSRAQDQATIGGELITSLVPAKRNKFKEFVEARYVHLDDGANHDDFFAKFDQAIDAVDPHFRRQHGIFFTDLDLSKFVLWLTKREFPELGDKYLVIDPACGSGNLVTNWRSPLELRHKVVSEIEPELLFAVDRRMKGDAWHHGKFTVVPRVSESRGLNFLDKSAAEYLDEIRVALAEKGQTPDKPLAILCNPPYRSDDDQGVRAIEYQVHPTITALTGADAARERYCCFLAQMKLICEEAKSSGLPGDSLLLLFTGTAWLNNRSIYQRIRAEIAGHFEDVAGLLINGNEFFDVPGSWPVAFTIWRYKGTGAALNSTRAIPLVDLTWVKRQDLSTISWSDPVEADSACRQIFADERAVAVQLGETRQSMRDWSGLAMTDFKRDRRKAEKGQGAVGGLPSGDRRSTNKKAYGESDGAFVGFMDDLTPCRVRRGEAAKPWFRLNSQFMDVNKNRCFSGPPTHWGYCARDYETAERLFFWYALTRTFAQTRYPMWANADDLWAPQVPPHLKARVTACAFAIGFAENECVETYFPANNPRAGVPEAFVPNPMTPLDPTSFWSTTMRPAIRPGASAAATNLIEAVDDVFRLWREQFAHVPELPVYRDRSYFIDDRALTRTAGLVQIRDYANENEVQELLAALDRMQARLRDAKNDFYELLRSEVGLNYFRRVPRVSAAATFDEVLSRRLALAGLIVDEMHADRNFGRTKLAKVFYLAEKQADLDLRTQYQREAAGPLDQRALYNERIGIETLAKKRKLFSAQDAGRMVRYEPLSGNLTCN